MATVKTAISLNESLYKKVDVLSNKLEISRSSFFSVAAEEFIQRYENRNLLDQINSAVLHEKIASERERRTSMKQKHAELIKGEW